MEKIWSKYIKLISVLLIIFLTSSKIFAVTNYVSKTGGHISPFNSWANAATNIQAAVAVAVPNDIVLVTNGIYDNGERVTPGYSCSNRVVKDQEAVMQFDVFICQLEFLKDLLFLTVLQ